MVEDLIKTNHSKLWEAYNTSCYTLQNNDIALVMIDNNEGRFVDREYLVNKVAKISKDTATALNIVNAFGFYLLILEDNKIHLYHPPTSISLLKIFKAPVLVLGKSFLGIMIIQISFNSPFV